MTGDKQATDASGTFPWDKLANAGTQRSTKL